MDSAQCKTAVVPWDAMSPLERGRSRLCATTSSAGGQDAEEASFTQSSIDATAKTTVSAARRHGAAVQTALERQMKAFEDRISTELVGLSSTWSSSAGLASSPGPAAAQAALAAALEACVERVAESEAYIVSVDAEVRRLRADAECSTRALDNLAVHLEGRWIQRSESPTPRNSARHGRTASTSPPPSSDFGSGGLLIQRIERLETDVRQLACKFDAEDGEIELLKAMHTDSVSSRDLADLAQALRADIDEARYDLRDHVLRSGDAAACRPAKAAPTAERAEVSSMMREQLAEAVEPLMARLNQLGEFAAHGEKAERDAAQARRDVERLRGDLKMTKAIGNSDEVKTYRESERLFHNLRSEFTMAIAELGDAHELLKQDLKCLSEKTAGSTRAAGLPPNDLEAVAQFVREEVKNFSRSATRHELQEATKLLLEVKDAGKLLEEEIKSADAPAAAVVTRQELSSVMEGWKREFGTLAVQVSEQIALVAPRELPAPPLEGKDMVTRHEITDIVDLLRQEIETWTKRVEKSENAVSKNEFTETVKLLRQELLVLANKAATEELVSRRQELIEVADLMKRELRSFTEKNVVTQQDLAGALEALKQELALRIQLPLRSAEEAIPWLEMEPLLARTFESLWSDRLSGSLRQDLLHELEATLARKQKLEGYPQQMQNLKDGLQKRFSSDMCQLTTDVKHSLSELAQRLGRMELEQHIERESSASQFSKADESEFTQQLSKVQQRQDSGKDTLDALLTRVGAICDRVSAVERNIVAAGAPAVANRLNDADRFPASPGAESLSSIGLNAEMLVSTAQDASPTKNWLPDMQKNMEELLAEFKKDHRQGQHTVETLLGRFRDLSDRVRSIEGSRPSLPIKSGNESLDWPPAASASAGTNLQVPMLALEQLPNTASPSGEGATTPQKSPQGSSLGEDSQALEKMVQPLRKRIADLEKSSATPRGGLSGEGVAQLLLVVKREQEQERVLVSTVLDRISSLCDRIGSMERKVTESTASVETSVPQPSTDIADGQDASTQAQVATLSSHMQERVEALQSDGLELKQRIDSLEGAMGRVDSLEGSLRDAVGLHDALERKVLEAAATPEPQAAAAAEAAPAAEVAPTAEAVDGSTGETQTQAEAVAHIQEQVDVLDQITTDLVQRVESIEGMSRRALRRTVQDYLGKDFTTGTPATEASASYPADA